jgi:putative membrane protein
MMAYPAFTLGWYTAHQLVTPCAHRLPYRNDTPGARGIAVTALVGGWLLTAWDLYLDPQMVDAGCWRWSGDGPALNGIPLSNTAGWLGVGILIAGSLAVAAQSQRRAALHQTFPDRLPISMIGWTGASSFLANLMFFDRPAVALAGGVGMGALLAGVVTVTVVTRQRHRPIS